MSNSIKNMMGAGLPGLAAQMIGGTVADGVAAAGGTQATATLIPADNVVVTTGAGGLVLPSTGVQPGDEVVVANLTGAAINIYPPVGGQLNALAVNASVAIAAGKVSKFIARAGILNWVSLGGS